MKNKLITLFMLTCMLPISGCSTSLKDKFDDFINANYFDVSLGVKAEVDGSVNEIMLANVKYNESDLLVSFDESLLSGIFMDDLAYVDIDEGKVYLLGYYTNISSSDENSPAFSIMNSLEIKQSSSKEKDDKLVATYTFTSDNISLDINANVYFKSGKVDYIEVPLDIAGLISENESTSEKISLIVDVNSYGKYREIAVPDAINSYQETSSEDFIIMLNEVLNYFMGGFNNEFTLTIYDSIDYYIGVSEDLFQYGEINDQEGNFITGIREFEFSGNYDLTLPGTYNVIASCEHEGITYREEFTLNVIAPELSITDTISISNDKINNLFVVEDYLLVSSETNLYKLDIDTKEILGVVDVKGITNNVKYKDGFLYATSNQPYEDEYMDYDEYDGEITKINFDTFEIEKQLHVDAAPYDLIIDNRGNVVFTLKVNQHVDMFVANLENQTFEQIDKNFASPYECDKLIYDEELDQLIVVHTRVTTQPALFQYNGSEYKYVKTLEIGLDFYSNIQDNIIYNYNQYAVYENGEINLSEINIETTINGYDAVCFDSYINDGFIYRLNRGNLEGTHLVFGICKYNINTKEYEYRTIDFKSFEQEYVYSRIIVENNKIYIVNTETGLIEIYNGF